MFCISISSVILTFPINAPRQRTFFNSNFKVDLTDEIFSDMLSEWVNKDGNFPALFNPGPKILGMDLMIESEAKKKSYLRENFFITFFLLVKFF